MHGSAGRCGCGTAVGRPVGHVRSAGAVAVTGTVTGTAGACAREGRKARARQGRQAHTSSRAAKQAASKIQAIPRGGEIYVGRSFSLRLTPARLIIDRDLERSEPHRVSLGGCCDKALHLPPHPLPCSTGVPSAAAASEVTGCDAQPVL